MKKRLINPPGTEGIYQSMQFSQAVRMGHMIWISGQVGMNEKMQMAEGIEAQSRQAFQNLQKVLEASGAAVEDVVELVTYHLSMKDIGAFAKVKSEFFKKDYPAWTAVGVKELVIPGLLVEIRATALVENTRDRD
ncbi:MAG: RidA family protein [Desulfobacterales bacterium]